MIAATAAAEAAPAIAQVVPVVLETLSPLLWIFKAAAWMILILISVFTGYHMLVGVSDKVVFRNVKQ